MMRATRLPSETRLGRVRLQVADLDRSAAYYEQVVGLETRERSAGEAALGAKGGNRVLVELAERPGSSPVPPGGRIGLYHFAILLPDRAALGRFVRHLGERGMKAGSADHLVSEAIYLYDPDRLGIEVYADRPREEWRWRNGEVVMATEPLDFVDLVRAGGEGTWDGAPAGTAVGHVHLHVGALPQAESFYAEALGFERTNESFPGALFLSAGGYHHHVGVNTWARGGPAGDGDARLLDWEVILPAREDAEAVADRVSAAGASVSPLESGWVAEDPWGTRVRIGMEG